MNVLKFEIWEDNRVGIFIDQRNLIDMLKEYEVPFAKKEGSENMAGQYWWIYKDALLSNLRLEYWNKPNLLGCECGEEACWPMWINIKKEDNKVIWSNFEQPFRTKQHNSFWDYSNFGTFTFDIENYQNELKKLES